MVSLGPGRWQAGVAVSVCIRNQCDNALLAVPLWLGLYHENRSLHLGGRSDCKENRPQLHANTRRFNHLSACICVHLRASVVEKSCFAGYERLGGGAEAPFSSIAVRA